MTVTIKVAMRKQSGRAVDKRGHIAGLLAISVTLTGAVWADTQGPPSLTEIIVTAQKRQENIQDVPVSVMALSGQELQDAGVRDIKELQVLTPGVTVTSTTSETGQLAVDAVPATKAGAGATQLDYNLLDLDATVQHVQMPSALHENVGFKERRTSLVDALKSAVEREPQRRDLRIKLLETYYAAAATNRRGFLDTVRKIAHERASLNDGEWDKIAWMGRQIASDDNLFAPVAAQSDEEELANCA